MKYPVIGEVQLKVIDLRDDNSAQKEEAGSKIVEITQQIPPPPIISFNTDKISGQRAENRVANPEDVNKRAIIYQFKNV